MVDSHGVRTVRITGRFVAGMLDGSDADIEPDAPPLAGLYVKLIPAPAILELPLASPPTTMMLEPFTLVTGEDGSVLNPETGATDIRLPADHPTPDGGTQRIKWTSEVRVTLAGSAIITKSWVIPADATEVDLTTVVPLPGTTIINLTPWEELVVNARSARDVAALAAQAAHVDRVAVESMRDATEALRDEVEVISGLTGEDDAVAFLVGSSTSDTRTALESLPLTASDDSVATLIGDGDSQTREAITQATAASVRTYPSMTALMATDAPTGSRVAIAGLASFDDVTNVMFQIQPTQPADRVLHRSSVPLDDGRWASPRDYQMMSQVAWDARGAAELIATAETYVAAGADLVYDITRPSPLWTTDIVHETQTAPYPITCSGFAGLVVGGYDYADTTYVADANTQTWRWGNTYPTAQYVGHPFGTNRFLKYFWQAGLAYYYSSGKTKLMPGDLLFYCKQDPEGPGTGGLYFLNNYHVAVYKGDGQVIHAYAPSSGNGVVQQALSSTPVDDICWIVRPPVKHVPLNKSPGPVATTAGFTGDVWTWVDDDLLQVDLNGISVASPLTAGSHVIMEDVGYALTRTVRRTALAVSGTTSTPVRILLTAAGVMQVYSPAAIPAGTVLHGGLSGHVTT